MDNNIILSICISAYNRRDLTCENVRKILRYEGDDIEVIVSDNASEDGTFEALKQIEDKRLRIYRNEINVGAGGNSTRLLTYAVGKYVMQINERDWVDYRGIQAFVRAYRERECDFILCMGCKELFDKNVGQIEGRMFLLIRFVHPGCYIIGRGICDKFISKVEEIGVDAYTEEWGTDLRYLLTASILYAKRWEHFRLMIRQPKPEKLARIAQFRSSVNNPAIFFTPEARMVNFRVFLDNPYIKDTDMEQCISGNYREQVYRSLSEFYKYRKDSYTIARYHYKPDPSVCWTKIAIDFYREGISVLKKKNLYTHSLAVKLGKITLREYIQLCKLRMEPWLKFMRISAQG